MILLTKMLQDFKNFYLGTYLATIVKLTHKFRKFSQFIMLQLICFPRNAVYFVPKYKNFKLKNVTHLLKISLRELLYQWSEYWKRN